MLIWVPFVYVHIIQMWGGQSLQMLVLKDLIVSVSSPPALLVHSSIPGLLCGFWGLNLGPQLARQALCYGVDIKTYIWNLKILHLHSVTIYFVVQQCILSFCYHVCWPRRCRNDAVKS